ncbi:MAG: peptidoglycan/xylan/chitin deacetylase (PgdA/CDA1 family) [Roseivirga sp.]|jgi:peptidoglycan/xylan/chitin deacetylase (PgdA/CDA1 family)
MVQHRTPALFKYLWPSLIWNIPNEDKRIFLTFDDGPIPGLTEWVLEVLNEFKVKATFFCVGDNVKKHPEIFSKLIESGHGIGNHTFHHVNGRKTPVLEYLENIEACDQVFKVHSFSTNLFRPPYGRLKTSQRKMLKSRQVVMWDVLSKDYDQSLSPESILNGIIKSTQPGSIIVFHDNIKAEKNLKSVLAKYIQYCLDAGYQFDTLC